ncbi:MAG: hypothetical protein GC129_04930 [Proteobacteria bacterium]|nr:hypothetical protein [Pseudomonadota bacterium]
MTDKITQLLLNALTELTGTSASKFDEQPMLANVEEFDTIILAELPMTLDDALAEKEAVPTNWIGLPPNLFQGCDKLTDLAARLRAELAQFPEAQPLFN